MRDNREMTDTPHELEGEERTTVTIRRAPKFSVFIVVGALIGFLVTLVLTALEPADPTLGFAATLGYFSLIGVPIGGVFGAVIAIALDYRASRRAAPVIASKLAVRADEHAPADSIATGSTSSRSNSSQQSAQRSDG